MSFSVLIVGLGQIGLGYDLYLNPTEYVYSHARAFNQHQKFQLIAAVDPIEEKRNTFLQHYQCPAYIDIESALKDHQPEIVIIATPTQLHNEVLQKVLALSKPRMILCEKPLTYDLENSQGMVEACAARNLPLYVNYMRRSDRAVIEIKCRLENERIRAGIKGIVWYSKGFLHNGSHFFNLLEYWLGSMQSSVVLDPGRKWGKNDSEPDVQITFERGTMVFLAAWEEFYSHYTVELLSPSGRLRYDKGGTSIQWQSVQTDAKIPGYNELSEKSEIIPTSMNRYQLNVTEQLANALDGREAHLCSGEDALQTLANMKKLFG